MLKRSSTGAILIIMLIVVASWYYFLAPPGQKGDPHPVPTMGILRVHFIDVGQGDAILVQTPSGQNMLIDAGDNQYGEYVVDYLQEQGVNSLAAVIGTHPHSDHVGGLDAVINSFPVKAVLMPDVTQNTKSFRDVLAAVENQGLKLTTAQAGVPIPLEGLDCGLLAPVRNDYEELNDYSVVVRLRYGQQTFLLMADAGWEPESQLLASGTDLRASVLKVGHHGSYASSSRPFLEAVGAHTGIIMLGQDNDYGYPHNAALRRLTQAGLQLYQTDINGTIVCTTDGQGLQITTER